MTRSGREDNLMPEQKLRQLYQKIRPQWKWAFASAFLIGFLTYLWHLVSFLVNGDSILNFHSPQNTIHLGRCFLTYACGISSFYDLPTVNGLLGISYVALCSVCVTELFCLRKKLSVVLTSALLVTFPSVASTFAYNYTADGYLLAMLFAALAVLLTCRFRYGFLAGAVLLCFSYGSYQAYLAFALMLILVYSIWRLLFLNGSCRDLLLLWGKLLLMGAAGSAAYLVCLRLMLRLQGKTLSSYQGVSGLSSLQLSRLPESAFSCLRYFKHFFLGDLRFSFYTVLQLILLLLTACCLLHLALRHRLYAHPLRALLTACCLLAIPFAAAPVYFISPDVAYHTLMCAGFSCLYLLPILYLECAGEAGRPEIVFSWAALAVLCLTVYQFFLAANILFLYMNQSYEITYGMGVRIADRIEQLETSEPIRQIGIIGEITTEDSGYNLNLPPEMTGAMYPYLVSEQFGMTRFLNDYFGFSLANAPDETVIPFVHSESYQEMDVWPGAHSVVADGDTVYIKFSDVDW